MLRAYAHKNATTVRYTIHGLGQLVRRGLDRKFQR